MSEDNLKKMEEDDSLESLDVVKDEEGLDEIDEDEFDEDDMEKAESEEKPSEKGAVMVLGQSEFALCQSNRGADDPGDNTLNEPQYICKYGDMLFVSDRGNNRVLSWSQLPQENGEPASLVLGQEDFADCLENRGFTTTLDEMTSGLGDESLEGFTISKAQEDTLSQPAGIAVIDGQLYVVDSGNHRVLRWNRLPSENGEAPNLVLGQDNLETNESNRRGFVGSGSLFFPLGIRSGDGKHVFVADKDNHRVLIWNKVPFTNGWNADVSLGQTDMDEREPNRGDYDRCGPDTLSFPTGVFYHEPTGKLVVVDQGNNRVLIWNKLPSQTGQAADVVIGQKDMYHRGVNMGMGALRPHAAGLYFPTDVVYGRKGFFVSDSGNHRVLCWREFPAESGQPADLVIGQPDFLGNKVNRGGETTASTLNDPFGLFLDEDPENEEDPGRLFIADRANSRVAMWVELPEPAEDEKPESDEHLRLEQDELMGDDDEFMEEETPPDKVPSA
ncbi:MAG: hypothetical protein HY579_02430 [Nitrospinae bacterium]|nr:hypothetical protein [Nitrospinota bacterium]